MMYYHLPLLSFFAAVPALLWVCGVIEAALTWNEFQFDTGVCQRGGQRRSSPVNMIRYQATAQKREKQSGG